MVVGVQSNDSWFDKNDNNAPIFWGLVTVLQKAGIREGSDGTFYDKSGRQIMGPNGKPATAEEVVEYVKSDAVDEHLGEKNVDAITTENQEPPQIRA